MDIGFWTVIKVGLAWALVPVVIGLILIACVFLFYALLFARAWYVKKFK